MEKALALIVAVSCSAMAISQIVRNCAIEYAVLFVAMAVCCVSIAVHISDRKNNNTGFAVFTHSLTRSQGIRQ